MSTSNTFQAVRQPLLHMRAQRGFTLIELMIVVVIIAVIAAFAIPSYQDSIRKSKRADAKTAISQAAARMEQFYLDRKTYTADLTDLGFQQATSAGNVAGEMDSPEGYYRLTAQAPAWGAGCFPNTCWQIIATAIDAEQLKDTRCRVFITTSRGEKISHNSGGADSSNTCW